MLINITLTPLSSSSPNPKPYNIECDIVLANLIALVTNDLVYNLRLMLTKLSFPEAMFLHRTGKQLHNIHIRDSTTVDDQVVA